MGKKYIEEHHGGGPLSTRGGAFYNLTTLFLFSWDAIFLVSNVFKFMSIEMVSSFTVVVRESSVPHFFVCNDATNEVLSRKVVQMEGCE